MERATGIEPVLLAWEANSEPQNRGRRVHQTLRVSPAMEAGVTDHVWTVPEIIGLLERA